MSFCTTATASRKYRIGYYGLHAWFTYRDPAALRDKTGGALFYIIKNGKGEMTPEGDRAKPDDIWNLVNFIRSLAKKEPGARPKTDTQ
jgi:hypothetical protein